VAELAHVRLADGLAGRVQPGDGNKVLWIHGYTLDSSSWSEMWRRLPGWYHIGLDLPGHGGSAPIGPQDDLRTLGRKVADLCREQDIRHLVALSFGTVTATQVLVEEPDHLWSIVLGAPALAGGPSDPDVGVTYGRLHQLYTQSGPGPEMTATWMSCIAWEGIDQQPALREQLGRLVHEHRWTEFKDWRILRLLQPPQREDDLRKIRTPMLILIGELDLPAFHACAAILQRTVPRCERVTLADTHHLCMLESPGLSAGPIERHLQMNDRAATRVATSEQPPP
jgi:2-succinyl-6-hydroxy-2,4-cyclohexadiene-1-carboxylate synthase